MTMPYPALPLQPEPFLLTLGDIGVTTSTVTTPNGTGPLYGSQWIVLDMSMTRRFIPTWAIVLAIIFTLTCLVGLLFLLVKEEETMGYVQVSVRTGPLAHTTQIPVTSRLQVAEIRALVGQVQAMAAQPPMG